MVTLMQPFCVLMSVFSRLSRTFLQQCLHQSGSGASLSPWGIGLRAKPPTLSYACKPYDVTQKYLLLLSELPNPKIPASAGCLALLLSDILYGESRLGISVQDPISKSPNYMS